MIVCCLLSWDEMKKEEVKTEEDVIRFLSDKTKFERDVYVATFKIPLGT